MAAFTDAIQKLEELGVSDVLLPFMLIFTVIFAVLERIRPFKDDDSQESGKKYHGIIALVFALAAVIPHVLNAYPNPKYDVVNIINNSLPNVSVIVVAVVAALILLGVFGIKFSVGDKSIVASVMWVLSFALIIFIFGSSAGWGWWKIPRTFNFLLDPDTQALLLIILVFGAIIGFVMKEEKSSADKEKARGERRNRVKNLIKDITE